LEGNAVYDRFKKIEYKQKEIIIIDYSGLRGEVHLKVILKIRDILTDMINNGAHDLLAIVNTRDSYVNNEVFDELKKFSNFLNPYIKKLAYVGITGIKKILLRILSTFIRNVDQKLFDSIDDAKEWLVK
jgi:alpha-N-acetylglucosamine transferase